MNRIVVKSRVGSNGVLQVTLPLDQADANREVQITVEPLEHPATTQEEWCNFILSTAGHWQGDFEPIAPGELEEREPLS